MMKQFYIITAVLIGFIGNAQIVNIPDGNFKAKLLAATATNGVASTQPLVYNPVTRTYSVSSYTKIDTNNDGQIQLSEAQAITYLDFLTSASANVSNFTGIESFTNLQYLDCSDIFVSSLTSLDLSQNTVLRHFNCFSNNLSNINISQCLALESFDCGDNNLSSLDVSQHTGLISFSCGSNHLTSLDVSHNTALQSLTCENNQIENLTVSQNPSLTYLNCSANPITGLNLSQNPLLTGLDCFSDNLTSLDLSQNPLLNYLQFSYNQITNIDLSHNPALKRLYCTYGQLTSLDVSQNHLLEQLTCNNAPITSLNVSQNPALTELTCYLNHLTTLDLQNTALVKLDCSNNQLTSLLIKNGNPLIWNILNFSGNSLLKYVCADEEDTTSVQQKINNYGIAATCQLNNYCSFTPGATFYTIQGNTRFDSDSNGCDLNDIDVPDQRFAATNGIISGSFISNDSGSYFLPVLAGNHTITPTFENPDYFTVSPISATISFPSTSSPATQNFCLTANGIKNDLEVTIIPTDIARPGFDANYKIIYKNKGNQTANGTLNFTFNDAVMDLISAIPAVNSSTINNLNWNFINLKPFETREIKLKFNLNSPTETPALNAGNILNYTASVAGATDEMPSDNTSALNQWVYNSLDPNDKTCLEGTTITPGMVGQYVHYLIRFENTGTFPAQNIVVKDMIDTTKFDVNSLVPLHSSHNFVTRVSNTNKVEFIFENINLPFDDANNDGYVAFKIKTKPTLVVGNSFSNSASIYFDYNFPIVTNNATTTIQALSSQDFDFGNYFSLYPNPVKDVLNIETKSEIGVKSINIYNMLGQMIIAIPNAEGVNSIDVANLRSGTYFIKVNTNKGTANAKFIKS